MRAPTQLNDSYPSIAHSICALASHSDTVAVTMLGGYLKRFVPSIQDFETARFPTGKTIAYDKNRQGRCKICVVQYDDGSVLTFTWSASIGPRYYATKTLAKTGSK